MKLRDVVVSIIMAFMSALLRATLNVLLPYVTPCELNASIVNAVLILSIIRFCRIEWNLIIVTIHPIAAYFELQTFRNVKIAHP